jgi:hypothetical protein
MSLWFVQSQQPELNTPHTAPPGKTLLMLRCQSVLRYWWMLILPAAYKRQPACWMRRRQWMDACMEVWAVFKNAFMLAFKNIKGPARTSGRQNCIRIPSGWAISWNEYYMEERDRQWFQRRRMKHSVKLATEMGNTTQGRGSLSWEEYYVEEMDWQQRQRWKRFEETDRDELVILSAAEAEVF